MTKIFLSLLLGLTPLLTKAQCKGEVQIMFDQVSEKVQSGTSYSVDFSLKMEYVGEPSSTEKGTITVDGNRFFLNLPSQSFMSDGTTLWIYLKKANEVQIFPMEDNSEWASLSPIEMLKQYCSDQYISRSLGLSIENKKEIFSAEFTPVDKDQDMFKVKISYDKNALEITRIKTFNKDGSRITLDASNYTYNVDQDDKFYRFDLNAHAGVHVEDMR